ncbi:hypothetical protein GCM10009540_90640 [Streptomyces turgidiscabies]
MWDDWAAGKIGRGRTGAREQAPVRVAVTGRMVGLPLFESVQVLGRERTSARIDVAVARLQSARADDSGARCARGGTPSPTAMSTTGRQAATFPCACT